MFTYTIIFFSSLVLMIGMIVARFLYKKLHEEHVFHRVVSHRAKTVNAHLMKKVKKGKRVIRYMNKKTFSLLVHYWIENIEIWFHKATDYVRSKLPHHK